MIETIKKIHFGDQLQRPIVLRVMDDLPDKMVLDIDNGSMVAGVTLDREAALGLRDALDQILMGWFCPEPLTFAPAEVAQLIPSATDSMRVALSAKQSLPNAIPLSIELKKLPKEDRPGMNCEICGGRALPAYYVDKRWVCSNCNQANQQGSEDDVPCTVETMEYPPHDMKFESIPPSGLCDNCGIDIYGTIFEREGKIEKLCRFCFSDLSVKESRL